MDFGKPDDPAHVDWQLPPDTELTRLTLAGVNGTAARVTVAGTGWSDRANVGAVYPPGTKAGDFLGAYARQFNGVELNATFYRVPDFRQIRKWYAAVPEDFRFLPKVTKGVSQAGDLSVSNSRALDFCKSVQHFGDKLGPCFLQLPQDFATDRVDVLREFLRHWPPTLRLAVEMRHPSWFATAQGAEAFADLAAQRVGAVVTDVGARRDAAHVNLTAPFAFVRWVGNDHESDEPRLAAWANRLAAWARAGLPDVYFVVHQPSPVAAARSAGYLCEVLRGRYPDVAGLRGPRLRDRPRETLFD